MQLTWSARNRSFGPLDALGLAGVLGLLVARFVPVARLIPFWGCTFRQLTGWPCPGCGLTRAAERFAHGHPLWAAQANPLGALAAALFALCAVYLVVHLAFRTRSPELSLSQRDQRLLQVGSVVALSLNYAFVIVITRFPSLLA